MEKLATIFDVRDEETLRYDSRGVAHLVESERGSLFFLRLEQGTELALHEHGNREDNAIVLHGTLSYLTGAAAPQVPTGGWVVARGGERHGYRNDGAKPLHLLVFTPACHPVSPKDQDELPQRIFRTIDTSLDAVQVYQTGCSRGAVYTLTPGQTHTVDYARAGMIFVQEGRVMTLVGGEKISIDGGEGIYVRGGVVELVGVAGHSLVSVILTRP